VSLATADTVRAPAHDPKHCTCCERVHDSYAWSNLPAIGVMMGSLELRNCPCGSTLAVELES
jgi:hypothetical protein